MRRIFLILFLLSNLSLVSNACSCVNLTSSCNRNWNSGKEVVFLGKAASITGDWGELREVHFVATEFFRGTKPSNREVVVYTGHGGGDCGYPFKTGTSYLVYAYRNNGRLMTGICSPTAPEVMVASVLLELRALRDSRSVDDLFGTIRVAPASTGWEGLPETRPLANIPDAVEKLGGHFTY